MIEFTTLSLFYLLLLCQLVAALLSEGTDKHASGVLEAPPCEMWPSLLDRFALVHSVSVRVWPRAPEITFSSVLFFILHYLCGEHNKQVGKQWLVGLVSEQIKKRVFKCNFALHNIGLGSESSMQTFTSSCNAKFSKTWTRIIYVGRWNVMQVSTAPYRTVSIMTRLLKQKAETQ